jgi:hypothetical protein
MGISCGMRSYVLFILKLKIGARSMTWYSWLKHSSLVIGFIFVSGCGDNPSDDVSVLGSEGDDSRGEEGQAL